MKVLKPRIRELLLSGIREIENAGYTPTPEEVIWLHSLAEEAVNPDGYHIPSFLYPAIKVGRIWLYPLTIQAHLWLDECAFRWWKDSAAMNLWATAYAMAKSRPHIRSPFEKLCSRSHAEKVIRAWAFIHLLCSRTKLSYAVNRLLGEADYVNIKTGEDEERGADASEWGDIVAMLCGMYHLSPEVFLWDVSAHDAMAMIRNAPVPSGFSKPEPDSAVIKAYHAFRMTVKHIISTRKEKESDGE